MKNIIILVLLSMVFAGCILNVDDNCQCPRGSMLIKQGPGAICKEMGTCEKTKSCKIVEYFVSCQVK